VTPVGAENMAETFCLLSAICWAEEEWKREERRNEGRKKLKDNCDVYSNIN
jgi:hypothetical protein